MTYQFRDPRGSTGDWPVLPEGDYPFSVVSCSFPEKTPKGYFMIKIELLVGGQRVWDNRLSGTGPKGEFDMISAFLICINRLPKGDQEKSPTFWGLLAGAKGRAHIVQDEFKGKVRNKVGFYHAPKQLQQEVSQEEYNRERKAAAERAGGGDLDPEPDDIPFKSLIYRDLRRSRLNRRVF